MGEKVKMKVLLLEDFKSNINKYSYRKGQIVEVVELKHFEDSYAVYGYCNLDWIPKKLAKVIE